MAYQGLAFPLSCVFGIILQQYSLYKESLLYKLPLTRSCLSSSNSLKVFFFSGVILELYSLKTLSLPQFFTLSCLHLQVFKYNYSKDHDLSYVQAEKLSLFLIASASLLTSLYPSSSFSTDEVLLDFFIIYQVCGATMLIVMRKLGFFSRKILFEASIPAHFTVGLIAGGRVFSDLYLKNWENPGFFSIKDVVFPCALTGLIGLGLASSFIKVYTKHYDPIVVYGSYLSWTVFLSFIMTYSLQFDQVDKYTMVCFIATVLCLCGNLLAVFQRIEYLKAVNEKHTVTGTESEVQAEIIDEVEDPQHLELQIDEDNLMDAEIIDEDLLIKTIRNI